MGHGGDQTAQLGEQAHADQQDAADGHHVATDHAGQGDQAHVLGIGGIGQRVEHRGEGGGHAVGHHAPGEFAVLGLTTGAADGDGGDVADGFQAHHEHDQGHADDGGQLELHAVLQRPGNGEPGGIGDAGEVDHAQRDGHQVAAHQTHQDGGGLEEAATELVDDDGHHQHEQRQAQVGGRGEVVGADPAGSIVEAHRHQGDADQQHHDAGHHRREPVANLLQEGPQPYLQEAGHQGGTQHGG